MFNKTKCKSSEDLVLRVTPSVTMGEDKNSKDDIEGNVKLAVKPKTKTPPLYRVLMMNDDYTPMDFVIEVLTKFFRMDSEKATQLMLTVHYKGKAVCGVYTAEIAETKVMQVNQYARNNQHPLKCTMEKA